MVLLLGAKEAWTPIPWAALEGVPELLRGLGWVQVGGVFDVQGPEGTFDAYLKGFPQRVTAGWVAVVLERAGVVDLDRSRPARVQLASGW